MSTFKASLNWKSTSPFDAVNYDRSHTVTYGSGTTVSASSAPEYKGDPAKVNPEEMLLAALMSCHMLTFLALAAKAKFVIDGYDDDGVASLGKNDQGGLWVATAVLRPRVVFSGSLRPDAKQLKSLHEKAHKHCFIANTIRTVVTVEPQKLES